MKRSIIIVAGIIALLPFLWLGCSTTYAIRVVDGLPKEVYLTFSKGADVKIGDIFVLYRHEQPPTSSGHQGHGGGGQLNLKREIGRVRVVRIVDEQQALVEILSGQVETGILAEKLK